MITLISEWSPGTEPEVTVWTARMASTWATLVTRVMTPVPAS